MTDSAVAGISFYYTSVVLIMFLGSQHDDVDQIVRGPDGGGYYVMDFRILLQVGHRGFYGFIVYHLCPHNGYAEFNAIAGKYDCQYILNNDIINYKSVIQRCYLSNS